MEDTITLIMIVKNESKNLKTCLDSVISQVDEIVIVDTDSTDDTLEIARRYTDKIYQYSWDADFSAARNFAISKANCAWILSLDADEKLVFETGNLRKLITKDKKLEAYLLPLNNPIADATGEYNRFWVLRLFKNNGCYQFRGKIHEQIIVSKNDVVGISEGPVISHKMLPQKERNQKKRRNLTLLQKVSSTDPDNPFLKYYIGVEWLGLGKPAKALPYFQQAYQNITDNNLSFRTPTLRYLIICLKSLGRLDDAIRLCLEADLRYPKYTDIYYLCGVLFEEKKEYLLAIKWLNEAVKCGIPPALFSHMNGAGSFLAHYHLGYCHAMLGQVETARNYYELALDNNPKYIYPVYNLFLLLLVKHGPAYTLEYLNNKGYLDDTNLALTIANLFYTSEYPTLAYRCLKDLNGIQEVNEEVKFYLGKYHIYSGSFNQGLDYLKQISEDSVFYPHSLNQQAIGELLLGRFRESRALALKLWKSHETRCNAWGLLSLIQQMEKNSKINCPKKIGEIEMLQIFKNMLDQCSNYLPEERTEKNTAFYQMINILESIIKNISPQGYMTLLKYYQDKTFKEQSFFDDKFGSGRS